MGNFFGIILPGILSYLLWTLHFNATRKNNILKGILVLVFSICPLLNWFSFLAFPTMRLLSIFGDDFNPFEENQKNNYGYSSRDENTITPFAMYVPYDKTTKSGKIIMWIVKDR